MQNWLLFGSFKSLGALGPFAYSMTVIRLAAQSKQLSIFQCGEDYDANGDFLLP